MLVFGTYIFAFACMRKEKSQETTTLQKTLILPSEIMHSSLIIFFLALSGSLVAAKPFESKYLFSSASAA